MNRPINMTRPEESGIIPTADNRRGWDQGKARRLDADYLKARERLRTILAGLSFVVEAHDAEADKTWGHVGDLNHYAEVIEGSMGLGGTMADGSSAFHPDNL